ARIDIARETEPVARAQPGRHDQLGHLAPRGLLCGVAERLLGGTAPLDHPAVVVDRYDAVERGGKDRPLALFALAHVALGTAGCDEAANLRAEAGHRSEQLGVGDPWFHGIELDRAERAARVAEREAQRGLQACAPRRLRPREVAVVGDVDDPRRLAGRPDTPGQATAALEAVRASYVRELVAGKARRAPRLHARDRLTRAIGLPDRPELARERLADCGQELRVERLVVLCGRDGLRNRAIRAMREWGSHRLERTPAPVRRASSGYPSALLIAAGVRSNFDTK